MDKSAIALASEAALEGLGLVRAGDQLNLISFCKSEAPVKDKADKRALVETFLSSKKDKFKTSSTLKGESSSHRKKDNTKTKKVQLDWKHFQDSVDKYVLVPLSKGGGCRFVSVPQTMGKFELMKLCKETFFPDGLSHYGKERDLFMDLTNFQDGKIEHTIVVNKVELPFNIGNYMEAYKLRNLRLYLRTKNIFSIEDEEEDEEEDDLPTYLQDYTKPDVPETQSNNALLIGTSEERKKIAEEQHDEYCLILNADIAKEEQQHKKKEFKMQEC